ncbi:MAG: DUF6125 family protein [Candidatus Methanospirareceae archaeon]
MVKMMDKEELLRVYAWFWGNLHQRWRNAIEEEYGLDKAIEIECKIMEKVGRAHAKKLKEVVGDVEGGLSGFIKVFRYLPESMIERFEIIRCGDNEIRIRNPSCTVQKARLRRGKPEYPCKKAGIVYFRGFAAEIDEKLRVSCVVCPPDKHPEDVTCEWRVEVC